MCNCKHHKCKYKGFEYQYLPQAHHLNPFTVDSSYPVTPAAATTLVRHGIVPFEGSLVVPVYRHEIDYNEGWHPSPLVPPPEPLQVYYYYYYYVY